jgi:hypothetical protein
MLAIHEPLSLIFGQIAKESDLHLDPLPACQL